MIILRGLFILLLQATSRLYAPGRGFQTSYGFISLNAWFWEIQNLQYAVDATAGVS
jgi:hypothetical protein